jgi:hypothetical protein
VKTLAKVTIVIIFSTLFLNLCAMPVQAQYGGMSIGSMTAGTSETCPGGGWYYYTDINSNKHYVNCFSTTVTACAQAQDMGLDYGYLNPVGLVPGVSKALGVIVLHNGGDGTTPNSDDTGVTDGDFQFADYFFQNGYVVVELAWNTPWEALDIPWPFSTSPLGNVQYAACRPATFFNWVFNNIYLATVYNTTTNPHAGFCESGFSAGGAAAAYSMAYYAPPSGGQWWFDAVALMNGPPVTDIRKGCKVPHYSDISVCGGGESWCHYSSPLNWTRHPYYVSPAISGVQNWTDDSTCNNDPSGTSSASNTRWWQQSLVDDGTNSPVFSYPNTSITGWLCRGLASGSPNNSSPQGYLYYQQVGPTPPLALNVWAVDGCVGAEGIAGGTVSTSGVSALTAIELDLAGNLTSIPPVQGRCTH